MKKVNRISYIQSNQSTVKTFKEYLLLEGVGLGASELLKPNSATREKRTDILRDLIKAKTPLDLVDGTSAIVIDIDAALAAIDQFERDNKNFDLVTSRGLIKNTKLKKSKVFGGMISGAGGGTDQTRITESAQCLWCAALLEVGAKTPFENITENDLRAGLRKIHVDAKFEEMLDMSDEWKMSAYLSAVKLIEDGYIHRGMEFHRGSRLMKAIYVAKNAAYKNNDMRPISDDKWNPGDIWAADPRVDVRKLDSTSIRGLQKSILEEFVNRTLVGISLKLVKKVAKTKEYNVKLPPDTKDYTVNRFGAKSLRSSRGDFWSTKSGEIMFDGSSIIQIRDSTAFGTIKGEIVGKTARGGGAGWGYIATAIKQVFRANTPNIREIANTARKAIDRKDSRALKQIYDVISKVENMSYEEFLSGIANKDAAWVHAKYGTCIFLQHVAKGGPQANRLVTKIVNYAASQTEDSSAYVKVYS